MQCQQRSPPLGYRGVRIAILPPTSFDNPGSSSYNPLILTSHNSSLLYRSLAYRRASAVVITIHHFHSRKETRYSEYIQTRIISHKTELHRICVSWFTALEQ